MELGIAGKTALVTGASRGLGREIALGLAREGARVAVVARSEADLATLVTQMGGAEGGHLAVALDLMPEGAPSALTEELSASLGPLDIVVHNLGGTLDVRDPLAALEDWRSVWRLNLEIAIEMNRVLIPAMQGRKWGRVLHVSSLAAVRSGGSVPYSTVKAALNAYVAGLGRVVATDNVVVTAVMPGPIVTPGGHWERVARDDPEGAQAFLAQRIAAGRFGTPEEVSDFVTFLCSERASFFAGAILPIDGGAW